MTYTGNKTKYAQYIVPILQRAIDLNKIDTYIECFVGGANIIDKIECKNKYGYDKSDTLIALLDLAAKDFDKVLKEGNRELWDKGKAYIKDGIMPEDMTLADIGAMEFFGSFNNGGFSRGYAMDIPGRNYYREAYFNLEKQAPALRNIVFKAQNYWELDPNTKRAVIYLDPPYQNIKQYTYARQGKMDYGFFWEWVRKISKNNLVFISEQQAPDDFKILWESQPTKNKTVERLYKLKVKTV